MYQMSDYILDHIRIVMGILNKYDPMGIAIIDESEYEIEAIDIGNRASVLQTDCLAEYIRSVFTFWFDKSLWTLNEETCLEMAKEIKEKIQQ